MDQHFEHSPTTRGLERATQTDIENMIIEQDRSQSFVQIPEVDDEFSELQRPSQPLIE